MNARLRHWGVELAPLGLYLPLALWQTRNAFFSPVAVILGGADQPDWTGTIWTWWWTWAALLSGQNPTVGSHNLFPIGLDPVAQYNLLDGLLLGWLIPALGPTRGYNTAGLILLAAAGYTGFQLSRRLGVQRWAAAIAGLFMQSSAVILVEVTAGRLGQALVFFAGLAFAGLLTLTTQGATRKDAILAGAYSALAALSYWYAVFFVAIGALPAALVGRRHWRQFVLAAGVCMVGCAPAVMGLMAFGDDLPGMARPMETWMADHGWTRGRYGLGMAMAQAHQPLWPVWAAPADVMDKRLSPVLLLLAFIGVIRGPRRWRVALVGAAAAGWVMTLGPWLRAPDGSHLPIPLPWLLLDAVVPYFDRLWWPERFELTVLLAVVPLAGMGLAWSGTRYGPRKIGCAVILAWAIEGAVASPYLPLPASPPRPFDVELYTQVDGPFITAPVMAPVPDIRHALWLQVLHQQPITAGIGEHLSGHVPNRWKTYVNGNGLLSALSDSTRGPVTDRVVRPSDVDALRRDGLRWVVIDSAVLPEGQAHRWMWRDQTILQAIWGEPEVRTKQGAAWRIEPLSDPVTLPTLGTAPTLPSGGPFRLRRD